MSIILEKRAYYAPGSACLELEDAELKVFDEEDAIFDLRSQAARHLIVRMVPETKKHDNERTNKQASFIPLFAVKDLLSDTINHYDTNMYKYTEANIKLIKSFSLFERATRSKIICYNDNFMTSAQRPCRDKLATYNKWSFLKKLQ